MTYWLTFVRILTDVLKFVLRIFLKVAVWLLRIGLKMSSIYVLFKYGLPHSNSYYFLNFLCWRSRARFSCNVAGVGITLLLILDQRYPYIFRIPEYATRNSGTPKRVLYPLLYRFTRGCLLSAPEFFLTCWLSGEEHEIRQSALTAVVPLSILMIMRRRAIQEAMRSYSAHWMFERPSPFGNPREITNNWVMSLVGSLGFLCLSLLPYLPHNFVITVHSMIHSFGTAHQLVNETLDWVAECTAC